jgi:alkylhydroperoxidase family enzyme
MALARYRESDEFSELEKLVLDYTVALTRTPADASDELVLALREHLDDSQLVELTTAIAWENFRARFNRGFAVEAQGFSEGACCPMPERA